MRLAAKIWTILVCFTVVGVAQEVPVDLPDGFSIKKVAGNDLVPDASSMTVGPAGAPIVCGPKYVRRLIDDNADGTFDSFETLATTKGIAQGVWFDGETLWLTVDGAIKRSVSRKKGQPFEMQEVVSITTNVEHGSHAIRKGPDGWWYVICGNATKIRRAFYSLADSPVKEPRAGFLMRFRDDVKTGEDFSAQIFCHGFRNAYDFDFDSNGNVFVYDSDGERDMSLPWYRPTRVFWMQAGDDAGWVSTSWKRPATFFDMPVTVGELGRGSPTGVAVCDKVTFGRQYSDMVFVGDWTFGRIGVARLGQGVAAFAKAKGNFGFAVTDLEFAAGKGLYVTTGGRGTEGSLYLITSNGQATDVLSEKKAAMHQIEQRGFAFPKDQEELPFARRVAIVAEADDESIPDQLRVLQLMLGGCEGNGMFAGHQAESPIELSELVRERIIDHLLTLLNRGVGKFELARLIGMLELDGDKLANELAKIAAGEPDPVNRIHYLNCLAVAGGKLDAVRVPRVAESLLKIRREIDAADLPVDRNWLPRMRQLAEKLFRDMRIAEAIVGDASFGQPSDVWIFDSLPEIFRELAVAKIASQVEAKPESVTVAQLRCVSGSATHLSLMRSFADRDEFTDVVVKAIYNKPQSVDRSVLVRGLKSFDLSINKASLIGLRKIGVGDELKQAIGDVFKLESRLGWTNPEVSVRDQIALLFQKLTDGEDSAFGYRLRKYDLAAEELEKQEAAMLSWKRSVAKAFGISMEQLSRKTPPIADVDFSVGDVSRGQLAFKKLQCATCHNRGGKNAGPALAGLTSRFSRKDIFRAIVDPNDSVPDRYRTIIIATADGQLFLGSIVYESKAGILLETNSGEVVRIDAADVESRRKSNRSLMPEGLLDQATPAEIADLWAYLETL